MRMFIETALLSVVVLCCNVQDRQVAVQAQVNEGDYCDTGRAVPCDLGVMGSWGRCRPLNEGVGGDQLDGIDNDCNGIVDEEDMGYYPDIRLGVCDMADGWRSCTSAYESGERARGIQPCVNGAWGICTPDPEPVESFGDLDPEIYGCEPGWKMSCGSQVGACTFGTMECNADGLWGPCINNVLPEIEICDEIDNNCDGTVDELAECGYFDPIHE